MGIILASGILEYLLLVFDYYVIIWVTGLW